MDMKKILQAIDSPSTASQPASDDMKKLMSIVTESKDNRLNAAESLIMQHYTHVDRPAPKKAVPSLISKYVEAVEQDRAELTEERLQESYALSQRVMEKMYPNAYFGKSGKFRHHIDRTHSISNSVWQSAKHSSDRMIGEDDEVDTVTIDIPLMIRLLEYAREDAKTDMDLHNVAEMLINLSKENEVLSMDHYDAIVGEQKALPASGDVDEGIFDRFKKKPEPQYLHLTADQRNLIRQYFPKSNVDIKMGGDGTAYVLPHNAHTTHGSLRIAFRNQDGQLMASVAHHSSASDAGNPNVRPAFHSDHAITSPEDMQKLAQLSK